MATEDATLIDDLDTALPTGQGSISDGDDEFRQLKSVLQNQFPNMGNNEVSASAVELSRVTGVTGPIQSQIDALNIVQGYAGFYSDQTGFEFQLLANNQWATFIESNAAEYHDGDYMDVDKNTGVLSVLAGTPSFVRVHAILSLKLDTIATVEDWLPMRAQFIKANGQSFPGSIMLAQIPDTNGQVSFVINAIDTNPAVVNETYRLQINQSHTGNLIFEVWSMHIWAEMIGGI